MVAWARTRLHLLVIPACSGMVAGLLAAGRSIGENAYLAQGLWRTSVRLAGDGALGGALAGVGAGLFLSGCLAWRRARAREPIAEGGPGLVLALSIMAALAFLLLPTGAPLVYGLPFQWVFGGTLLVLWAMLAARLLARVPDASHAAHAPEGVWAMAVTLGYVVGLSQLWARLAPGAVLLGGACGGFLVLVALYAVLRRPVLSLSTALGRRLQGAPARRLQQVLAGLLGLGVALWAGGHALDGEARASLRGRHPNLLIIAVDTLREDRVSLLATPTSGWDLTPNLRRYLSPHGTYFRGAHAQASWTMPAFASMLTGLYPEAHGAEQGTNRLPADRLTLAEVLREAGYQTTAVVSGEYVGSGVGMLQGFDTRDESQIKDLWPITSPEVTDRALGFLQAQHDQPFFLFVHYFDPHWTYRDHSEFNFARGLFKPGMLPYKLKRLGDGQRATFCSPRGLAEIKALYAEDIAFTDLHIGRLLEFLDDHRLWDSTCVIFVGDHGDEFLEHNSFEHESTLFEEVLRVPLFIADPRQRRPRVVDDVVETRWLFGTALDLVGVRRPAGAEPTPDLFSPPHDGGYHVRGSLYNPRLTCLIGPRYKLITGVKALTLAPRESLAGWPRDWRSAPQLPPGGATLFDLQTDPGETKDASQAHPEVARQLRADLQAQDEALARLRERDAASAVNVNRDDLRRLRDLGYL